MLVLWQLARVIYGHRWLDRFDRSADLTAAHLCLQHQFRMPNLTGADWPSINSKQTKMKGTTQHRVILGIETYISMPARTSQLLRQITDRVFLNAHQEMTALWIYYFSTDSRSQAAF